MMRRWREPRFVVVVVVVFREVARDEKNSRLTTIWPVRRPTLAAEAKTSLAT